MRVGLSPVRTSVSIAAIIPTIGRKGAIENLLASLFSQSVLPTEIIIADGSGLDEISDVVRQLEHSKDHALDIRLVKVSPPNAVGQRVHAINSSTSPLLLLLDDDVVLDPNCIQELLTAITSQPEAVAVSATFSNQDWSTPTRAWSIYLRLFHGVSSQECQGKVVGPLLRFGFLPSQKDTIETQWMGAGMSLIRRDAYDRAGGFSDFFLHRCTMNEDVDLSLKLGRVGKLYFCPSAKLAHFHAPTGRVSALQAAEDDVYNRYSILTRTLGQSKVRAFTSVLVYVSIESTSALLGSFRRLSFTSQWSRVWGRARGLLRILLRGLINRRDSH